MSIHPMQVRMHLIDGRGEQANSMRRQGREGMEVTVRHDRQ